ncbi:carboxypeptidase C prc1 [Komagataella kurtzmanii]|nr:carboxypeptidase C prc1 [Komagataella kurtzmanii]
MILHTYIILSLLTIFPKAIGLSLQMPMALEASYASLVEKATLAVGHEIDAIQKGIQQGWLEVETRFPTIVSQLSYSTGPKFAIKKKDATFWDFHVESQELPNYRLRVKRNNPEVLKVDYTKQYSGYLDVEADDKHFFYWFFESRNDPQNDPIILWLNGGPGCSSLTGLFFELGSSRINEKLKPIFNPYSWNGNASIIYLDQPVNVGFSYSSSSVSNTVVAGEDVYAFLQLFFQHFPEYQTNDFHIAGESYAGHYIPVFADEILSQKNRNFNLTSVLIGNGLTDPLTQYRYYEPMACGEGGAPSVLPADECENMLVTQDKCLSLIQACYDSQSAFTCAPAAIYCNNAQMGPYQRTGKNVYDIRKECDGGSLCYKDLEFIDTYLNQKFVQDALGAEVDTYESCNFDINRNFLFAGDWMKPYHEHVSSLLNKGLPVLIYAGDKDFICNWLGNRAWTNALPWVDADGFEKAEVQDWLVNGKKAGEFKNYSNFTYLRVYDAGHMAPYDQPENSHEMVNRWISGDFSFH